MIYGQTKIATANTAVAVLAANGPYVAKLVLKALATNTTPLVVATSAVTSAADGTGNGFILLPGDIHTLDNPGTSGIFVNGATAGDILTFTGA